MRMLALEDAALLPQEHDREIFLVLRMPWHGDNVEKQREDTAKDEEHHAARAAEYALKHIRSSASIYSIT